MPETLPDIIQIGLKALQEYMGCRSQREFIDRVRNKNEINRFSPFIKYGINTWNRRFNGRGHMFYVHFDAIAKTVGVPTGVFLFITLAVSKIRDENDRDLQYLICGMKDLIQELESININGNITRGEQKDLIRRLIVKYKDRGYDCS